MFFGTFFTLRQGGDVFLDFFKAKNEKKLKKEVPFHLVKNDFIHFGGPKKANNLLISNFLFGDCSLK